jgi:hypothetical protein
MKREWIIAIAALGCITPLTAYAQEPTVATVSGQAATTGPRTVMGTVTSRVTVDRPYSAEAVNQSLQLLPDGNKIQRTTVTRVYRDSAGRTRREMLNDDGSVRSITISDPVSKVSYTLDPATRTATKGGAAVVSMGAGGGVATAAPSARAIEPGTATRGASVSGGGSGGATAGVATLTRSGGALVAGNGNREALDPQIIEGLNVTGTRTTTIIPAGQVGNAQELRVISEQWMSDDLQLLVMTRHSDPRSGETLYRLRNVVRGEPDPSLFALPADYTVVERR